MISRRRLLQGAGVVVGSALALRDADAQSLLSGEAVTTSRGSGVTLVETPNGKSLSYREIDGVKVFHLIAEPITQEFAAGLKVQCWGYNGMTPGPTIEVVEGDRVRIYVTNKLPEGTSVHWHGLFVPNGMDGVAGLTQKPIKPGQTFKYEFQINQSGTFMYHPHLDEMTQMALGLMGMIVVHPREAKGPAPDRDFSLMLSEWYVKPGTSRPDPLRMNDFNILTINGKAYPGTAPLVVRQGQRVRIRLGNLSAMDHHPVHLHGHAFKVIATDGGSIPEAGQWPETTVLVPVGSTREVEFIANLEGDWPLHCHMTHHAMNQMGHDLPNMIGADMQGIEARIQSDLPEYMAMGHTGMQGMGDMGMAVPTNSIPMKGAQGPFGYIDMGGMFTILKVRAGITSYEDPGWYQHPAGSVASLASKADLERDLGTK